MEILSPDTPYLSHILLVCALSHVSPPQFRRELKKFGLQHTQNAVFYCDKAVYCRLPAETSKVAIPAFSLTITTLQKNSNKVIPTLFPEEISYTLLEAYMFNFSHFLT